MREIYKIYASTFFVGLALSVSVISTLYYLANGLNQAQVATIFSVFMIGMALFEIPTGGIADTFGHKKSVFLGISVHALSSLITALSSSFEMFLFAMILAALGFALVSGAYSSLIHDILNKLGKAQEFTKVNGRMGTMLLVGPLFASPFMSLLYTSNIRYPWLLAFTLLLIAAILMFLVKWEFKDIKPTFGTYFQKMKNGVITVIKSKPIIGLIIISIGLGFGRSLFYQNINQPYQLSIGVSIALIGTVAAIISGADALVSAFAHKLFDKIGSYPSLLFIVIVPALSLIVLSQINTLLGLLPILIFLMVHTYRETVIMTLYQKESQDTSRATMISTTSFLTYIFVGLMLPIGGLGIDALGIRSMLLAIAILSLLLSLTGIFVYAKSK
ncbi:MFS transporter [Candidatus Daviesbacteria bacterium]|nr:MFS transporter [Candidatus Daviesbacteria bacterium]